MLQVGPLNLYYLVSSFGQLFSFASVRIFLCELRSSINQLLLDVIFCASWKASKYLGENFSPKFFLPWAYWCKCYNTWPRFNNCVRYTSNFKAEITELTIDIDVNVKSFKAFPLHNFLCYESIYIYYEIVYKLLTNFCRLFVYFCNFRVLFRKTYTKLVNHLYTAVCI